MPDFPQILSSMIAYLQEKKSRLSDFTPTSILYQILAAVASVIDPIYYAIENAKKQAYITTATDTGLDAKGGDLGVPRKQATPAQWKFTFTKKQPSPQDIPIDKGKRITTIPQPGQEPITFQTDANAILPAGSLSVDVFATCQQPGSLGNIAPSTTPLRIASALPGIDGVELRSKEGSTLGSDTESDEDYRKRLLAALASKAQGTVTWYEQTALAVQGVKLARVATQKRGIGTVDIYIVAENNEMPDSHLLGAVQAVIDAERIITDDAKVFAPNALPVDLGVSIQAVPGADANELSLRVKSALDALVTGLGIGGGSLGKLYLSQVLAVTMNVDGVINALVTLPSEDIDFDDMQLPIAGTITVGVLPKAS